MTSQLQQAIELARSLPLEEQLELLKTVSTIIQQSHLKEIPQQKRRSGILKGTFVLPLPNDFDEPLEDFKKYME